MAQDVRSGRIIERGEDGPDVLRLEHNDNLSLRAYKPTTLLTSCETHVAGHFAFDLFVRVIREFSRVRQRVNTVGKLTEHCRFRQHGIELFVVDNRTAHIQRVKRASTARIILSICGHITHVDARPHCATSAWPELRDRTDRRPVIVNGCRVEAHLISAFDCSVPQNRLPVRQLNLAIFVKGNAILFNDVGDRIACRQRRIKDRYHCVLVKDHDLGAVPVLGHAAKFDVVVSLFILWMPDRVCVALLLQCGDGFFIIA